MQISFKNIWIFIVPLVLGSCKIIAPQYCSTENLANVKPGMSYSELNQVMGIHAYDVFMIQEDGVSVYVWNYRVPNRRVPKMIVDTKLGLTAGSQKYLNPSKVYFIMTDGKLSSMLSNVGQSDGPDLIVTDNTINQILRYEEYTELPGNKKPEGIDERSKKKAKKKKSKKSTNRGF